jgi:hypothetical protein
MNQKLGEYIKNLLARGKSKEEIKNALLSAGWKENDTDEAIAEVSVEGIVAEFPPPVPPSLVQHSMVEIFINLLSFILMGSVATAMGTLFFQVINYYFVDPLSAVSYSIGTARSSAINYSIASLIIGAPLYVWALSFWFKRFRAEAEKTESRLSKWLTYIVLLLAAGTIIGDLITTVFNFLQGELSVRVFLKALTILVIAGMVFGFYYLERKKIQYKKPVATLHFQFLGYGLGVLALGGIVLGVLASGTPGQQRLRQFDLTTAQNLSSIASGISEYARAQATLPPDLETMRANPKYTFYFNSVTDLSGYEYQIISGTQYELCGTFNLSNLKDPANPDMYPYGATQYWDKHSAGRVCKTLMATFPANPVTQ